MEGSDACVAPVLDFMEAPGHPHHRARGTYVDIDGLRQPAPAPRFSRTGCDKPGSPSSEGEDTVAVLQELGYGDEEIAELRRSGVLT